MFSHWSLFSPLGSNETSLAPLGDERKAVRFSKSSCEGLPEVLSFRLNTPMFLSFTLIPNPGWLLSCQRPSSEGTGSAQCCGSEGGDDHLFCSGTRFPSGIFHIRFAVTNRIQYFLCELPKGTMAWWQSGGPGVRRPWLKFSGCRQTQFPYGK